MLLPALAAGLLVWFLATDFKSSSQQTTAGAPAQSIGKETSPTNTTRIEIHISGSSTEPTLDVETQTSTNDEPESEDDGTQIRIFKNGREEE